MKQFLKGLAIFPVILIVTIIFGFYYGMQKVADFWDDL